MKCGCVKPCVTCKCKTEAIVWGRKPQPIDRAKVYEDDKKSNLIALK